MKKNIFSIILLSSSGFLVGGLGYVYQIFMVRLLDTNSYAEFSSLLAIINIFTLFLGSFVFFLVKEIVKKEQHIIEIIYVVKKYVLYGTIGIGIILLCSIPIIKDYLKIKDTFLILTTISVVIFSTFGLYHRAFFQSQKYFQYMAGYQSINAVLKLIIGVGLIAMGFQAGGGIGGILITMFLLTIVREIHIYTMLRDKTQFNSNTVKQQFLSDIKNQKKQILQYLTTSILIALFMNIDILIVKNMFDGETAGYYAAVSVLAKFLVFLGLSIETVYYPQLVKEAMLPKVQVLKISVYYLAMTVGAIIFFMLFGEFILRMFKGGLEEYIGLVYPLLVYCGLLAYLSVIVKTLIAFERYRINYILGCVIVGLVICLYSFGSSPLLITQIFALFGGVGLVVGLWELRRS